MSRISRHKMQQNLLRLTAVSGGLNQRTFQRLAPSPSSGSWRQQTDDGDGASLPNVGGFEPPVAFDRFYWILQDVLHSGCPILFLWIIPFPHPHCPPPPYLLKFSDRDGDGDDNHDIPHYNCFTAGDSSLTKEP